MEINSYVCMYFHVSHKIAHLINSSYQQGPGKSQMFAPFLKAQTPVHSLSVSLTSCGEKIQEMFIIKKFMPTILSVCKNQYAYLPLHSTASALVRATHTWLSATDSETMIRVLLDDMSKAF